ncbi:MAG: YdcF family protein [Clostridia bacterium]|nr:YdcF family protein [Clostridia bacterium]
MKRFIKIILIVSIIVPIITLIIIHLQISYYANHAKPSKADVIIVLGCQVWGKSPSWSLEYRLQKALELYQGKYANHIIVSGGQGKDEAAPEASVMKNWLVSRGVPGNFIIEEGKSTNTFENLSFSKNIMDKNSLKTAIIVSNDFHIFRSLRIAGNLGITATGAPAPTVDYLKSYYHSREILSVIKSIALNR